MPHAGKSPRLGPSGPFAVPRGKHLKARTSNRAPLGQGAQIAVCPSDWPDIDWLFGEIRFPAEDPSRSPNGLQLAIAAIGVEVAQPTLDDVFLALTGRTLRD